MTPADILSQFGLSKTAVRLKLIEVLCTHSEALSAKEIEEKMGEALDRVTLYRTIKLFEEKQLIHKIVVDDQTSKYKLVTGAFHPHPHFHCTACDTVVCLPETPLPNCQLPSGFTVQTQNTLVEGTCNQCSK